MLASNTTPAYELPLPPRRHGFMRHIRFARTTYAAFVENDDMTARCALIGRERPASLRLRFPGGLLRFGFDDFASTRPRARRERKTLLLLR